MITVKAQTHQGLQTFDETSEEQTKHEIIMAAAATLFDDGGVIKCGDNKFVVVAGNDFAVQDNEQDWIE
jgi:hypothetical protein